jgi:DNA polymerase III subunit delta
VDFPAFRAHLRQKKIFPAYLFTGDQDLLKSEAVDELRRLVAGERAAVRSFFGAVAARDVVEAHQNLSLLEPVGAIVVRQAAKLARADADDLAVHLTSAAQGPPVVFWDERLDRRIELFGAIARAGAEVEFGAPRGEALAAWVRSEGERLGHRIGPDAARALVELVGDDLLALRSTLERVSIAIGPKATIDEAAIESHVQSSRLHAIYELQDELSAQRTVRAIAVFRRLVDEGGEAPALVGALVAHVRRLLLAREAPREADLAALLGVAPGRARHLASDARRFAGDRLRRSIDELAEIDVAAKTGRGDANAALEEWVIGFCAPSRPKTADARRG